MKLLSPWYITHVNHLHILARLAVLLAVFPIKDCPPGSHMDCQRGTRVALMVDAPVLVQLDSGDDNVAGVNTNGDRRAVRLVPLDTVNVDDPLLTVHLRDLAFPSLVLAPHNADLVVLADG